MNKATAPTQEELFLASAYNAYETLKPNHQVLNWEKHYRSVYLKAMNHEALLEACQKAKSYLILTSNGSMTDVRRELVDRLNQALNATQTR